MCDSELSHDNFEVGSKRKGNGAKREHIKKNKLRMNSQFNFVGKFVQERNTGLPCR